MTPNCENCNDGAHERCTARFAGDCQCRERGHVEVSTDDPRQDGKCDAALNISGEHFWCDLDEHHGGLAHSSQKAEAIWSPVPDSPRATTVIPMYAMLDLYVSLGFESANFDGEYAQRGYAGMWSWLLARVRSDKGVKKPRAHRSYPALIETALRDIKNANITGVSVAYGFEDSAAYYTFTVEG